MPDCIPVYMQTQYFHRKGRDPSVSSGTSGNPYPAKTKICPLNSLNTSQKNTPKSASIFCSNLLLPLVFFHFSYSSILVPASLYPASHCFPLPFLLLFPSLLSSSSSFSFYFFLLPLHFLFSLLHLLFLPHFFSFFFFL